MARHRDVRNLDANDFDSDYDYGSSYSGSFCDEVPLSSSIERDYMYRRNASGTTPKLTHFMSSHSVDSVPEEDEEGPDDETGIRSTRKVDYDSDDSTGSNNRRHSSGSSLLEALDDEETKKLAECLEQILDVVGESMPEIQVKEAIVRCDFNVELALNTLLNNPSVFGSSDVNKPPSHRGKQQPRPTNLSPPPIPGTPSLPGSVDAGPAHESSYPPARMTTAPLKSSDVFDSPTTVSTPILLTAGSVVKTLATPVVVTDSSNLDVFATPVAISRADKSVPTNLNLSAATKSNKKRMEIRSRTPSPGVAPNNSQLLSTPTTNVSTPVGPTSTIKMRKKEVNATEEYSKAYGVDSGNKCLLNLVVVGHVDSGKSTLMGHLLFLLGQVSSRIMHKYEQDSRKVGKQSFAYAWVLDETDEERSRGITMDVGQNRFETKTKAVTLLDAPGHRDFIPNMISGAYQADVAILVVNATRGEFEAGFDSGGQTREHALLVRSLGVTQLLVAVNKLDTVKWSQERFNEIVAKLKQFLKQVGFKDSDVRYVPCSGLTGDNLIEGVKSEDADWYRGKQTLVEAIDTFAQPPRLVEKPFRLSISDVFKSSSSGFCVAGRIESGIVMPNDRVLIQPSGESATVKVISRSDSGGVEVPIGCAGSHAAFCGEHVSLILTGIDQANISNGMVVCDPQFPVPVTKHFRAKIVVFNVEIPIIKGTTCVLHYGSVQTQATVKKLVAMINKATGEPMPKAKGSKPRCLGKNSNAVVEITTEAPICLELYSNIKELGRFMLRSGGKTIAAGMAIEIY